MRSKIFKKSEIICRSPKECLKERFKFGIVEDNEKWIEIFEDKNLTSHTYDEETAEEVYGRLPGYLEILQNLKDSLQKLL